MALYQHANPLNMAGISVFDVLREELDIGDLVEHDGRGQNCRCPSVNHEDKNPSARVYEDGRIYCFSCGWLGDAVDVWAERKGFDNLLEAALDLAREYGVRLPETNPEARARAQEARMKEEKYSTIAGSCHKALRSEAGARVREWYESRGFGEELQSRFLLGANRDGDTAVIPYWCKGRIVGMIRRPIDHDGSGAKYIYSKKGEFAPGHRPLFIPGPLQREVFVVEGIMDALALAAIGKSAIAVGGTNLSVEQIMEVEKVADGGRRLFLLPDADEDGKGKRAAVAWARHLYPAALICRADYAGEHKDFGDLFAVAGPDGATDHLGNLIKGAVDLVDMQTQVAKDMNLWRDQFAYATQEIVPLVARVEPESMRAATIDAVSGELKHIKVQWLKTAVKEEYERILQEGGVRMMQAMQEAKERAEQEHRQWLEENAEEINDLLKPGVLERMRKQAARMHNVKKDVESLKLAILVALGAQLAPLPSGRPLGASMLLTGEAGRGKNHNVDAACRLLPEEFYFAFEIASGQSLYYMAELDPNFLSHTFAYPNEIEGAEALWEFLRPMLSKGRALKIVTAKDAEGNMTAKEIMVEGPVSIAIPTIRNRTDEQLQTRLLVSELTDYPGRVKEHSRGVTEQLHPKFAQLDFTKERKLWQEALRSLTTRRRVVAPVDHPDFALDDDGVSHGARLWANLLGLMASHAWLEQRNREIMTLPNGEEAIISTPEDYRVAYEVFSSVCKRSVINLSDKHRDVLNAVYDLSREFPNREGFTYREIAAGAKCSPQTVSNHKTFLVTSAKMLRETEHGLALPEGADPSWWQAAELTQGLPSPEKAREYWDDPAQWAETPGQAGQESGNGSIADTYGKYAVHPYSGQSLDVSNLADALEEEPKDDFGHVQAVSTIEVDGKNGLDKPDSSDNGRLSSLSSDSSAGEGGEDDPGVEI